MPKIFSLAILVAMVVLLVPTGLVLASQDAVPGDKTYPIKRSLEKVIIKIASLTPQTRAFFNVDLANRRFKEATVLLARGDIKATASLQELVSQTQQAADVVSNISDLKLKEGYVQNLKQQITVYNQKLSSLEQSPQPIAPQPSTALTPKDRPTIQTSSTPVPQPATNLGTTPTIPPPPVQTPVPTSNQSSAINQTINDLNRIIVKLETSKHNPNRPSNIDQGGNRREDHGDRDRVGREGESPSDHGSERDREARNRR